MNIINSATNSLISACQLKINNKLQDRGVDENSNYAIGNLNKIVCSLLNYDTKLTTPEEVGEFITKLNSKINDVKTVLANSLSKDELFRFETLANEYAADFGKVKSSMVNDTSDVTEKLIKNIQSRLTKQSITINNGNNVTDVINNENLSFFALLIVVILFGYNTTAEYGKLMLLKQKDAQAAASNITELQKMLLELKNLVGDDKNSCKSLFELFAKAYGENPDKDIKAVLDKYKGDKGVLQQIKDPATGVSYLDEIDWSAKSYPRPVDPDNPLAVPPRVATDDERKKYIIDVKAWDANEGKVKEQSEKFLSMMNGYIGSINKNLTNNGVSQGMTIQLFDSKDPMISYSSDSDRKKLNTYFDTNGKNCETCSSQLTTINQNIQASVSQATETVKSLLEWLKQAITGYGTAINPR